MVLGDYFRKELRWVKRNRSSPGGIGAEGGCCLALMEKNATAATI